MTRFGSALVFCTAISTLLASEQAYAKSRRAAQREAEAATRAWLRQLSKEQLLEKMEYREKEISELWPKYTEAYSRLCAAIAATAACTNFPSPAGPPVMAYNPYASGHAISPMYLSPGKVYQLSEASPVYRRIVQEIVYNRSLAMTAYMRIQALTYELRMLEAELKRRANQHVDQ